MRLALEELAGGSSEEGRPDFWPLFWERYVENKLDYKSGMEVLKNKHRQAGEDIVRLLRWLDPMVAELRNGLQVELLREVFEQQYERKDNQEVEPVKEHATGVVRNPHDPDAQWSAKSQGPQKKSWVGYTVQVAETIPEKEAKNQPSTGGSFILRS